jgi:chemotaxis family two-component system sensor kinase Cph1
MSLNALNVKGSRPATDLDLAFCAAEPIHIPGAIQPHGVVLAAVDLKISHASANLDILTGSPAAAAIGRDLADVIGKDALAAVLDTLGTERYAPVSLVDQSLPFPHAAQYNLRCHLSDNRLVLEIEPADAQITQDSMFVLVQSIFTKLRQKRSLVELFELGNF